MRHNAQGVNNNNSSGFTGPSSGQFPGNPSVRASTRDWSSPRIRPAYSRHSRLYHTPIQRSSHRGTTGSPGGNCRNCTVTVPSAAMTANGLWCCFRNLITNSTLSIYQVELPSFHDLLFLCRLRYGITWNPDTEMDKSHTLDIIFP